MQAVVEPLVVLRTMFRFKVPAREHVLFQVQYGCLPLGMLIYERDYLQISGFLRGKM